MMNFRWVFETSEGRRFGYWENVPDLDQLEQALDESGWIDAFHFSRDGIAGNDAAYSITGDAPESKVVGRVYCLSGGTLVPSLLTLVRLMQQRLKARDLSGAQKASVSLQSFMARNPETIRFLPDEAKLLIADIYLSPIWDELQGATK